MNRRGFFGLLASTPVALVAGAELAELLAPRRTIFLPPRGGWLPPSWGMGTFSNVASATDLTEESLEKLLKEILKHPGPYSIRPTTIIPYSLRRV